MFHSHVRMLRRPGRTMDIRRPIGLPGELVSLHAIPRNWAELRRQKIGGIVPRYSMYAIYAYIDPQNHPWTDRHICHTWSVWGGFVRSFSSAWNSRGSVATDLGPPPPLHRSTSSPRIGGGHAMCQALALATSEKGRRDIRSSDSTRLRSRPHMARHDPHGTGSPDCLQWHGRLGW